MPRFTYHRPWLYPKQEQALFCAERWGILEGSTKSGKSVAAMVWLAEQALTRRGVYYWISPIYLQATVVFERMKEALPRELYAASDSKLSLTLPNGSVIFFRSAEHPDALYSDDCSGAVLDEATRMKEEAWWAAQSVLTATGGPARIVSNVKGRHNWCYRLARAAEQGEPDWHYARLIAADAVEAGIISAKDVEAARRNLPDPVFRELYMAEASEDGSNPFGVEAIQRCIAPLGNGPAVCYGVDLAEGKGPNADWTVICGLNAQRELCWLQRFQLPWPETKARIQRAVGDVRCLVDETGVGSPIVADLQQVCGDVTGYLFSAPSKQRLMESLSLAIQQGQISFPDGIVVRELEQFEFEYGRTGVKYSAPAGLHDDVTCALALANFHFKEPVEHTHHRIRRIGGGAPTVPLNKMFGGSEV